MLRRVARIAYKAIQKEVLSLMGKLWNATFVLQAGKYLGWHLLRKIGLHYHRKGSRGIEVPLGRKFHKDSNWWKWCMRTRLLKSGV